LPEPHVFLGDWAQLILVAPATANVVGRIAGGRSDDIVTATLLAARCPVVIAPAMNDAMWAKDAVQENLTTLRRRGVTIVEPESGHLASGHVGSGRLASSQTIFNAMVHAARSHYDLAGRRVVVTAGGTREPIDPVAPRSFLSAPRRTQRITASRSSTSTLQRRCWPSCGRSCVARIFS